MTQIESLQRRVKALSLAVAALAGLCAFSLFSRGSRAEAGAASITARRIAVVDDQGVERVVISAPAPEARVNGKPSALKRAGAVSGIVIYDRHGTERGGYLTADDASDGAMLTL